MQRIVVWGMKCVSYDYGFESDLSTRWKALDHTSPQKSGSTKRPGPRRRYRRRQKGRQQSIPDDSEDEDGVPTATPRDHLPRKARRELNPLEYTGIEIVGGSDSEDLSDDDEDGPYHDATGGELSDQE